MGQQLNEPKIHEEKNTRMRSFRASLIVLCVLVFFCGAPAYAQKSGDEGSKVDLFGGLSFLVNNYAPSTYTIKGWHVQGTYNLTNHLGFMADFSGYSDTSDQRQQDSTNTNWQTLHLDQKFKTFAFGPSFSVSSGKMRLSAHTLAGFSRAEQNATWNYNWGGPYNYPIAANTGMTLVLGGSADYMFRPHWGWRMLQADYVHSVMQQCSTQPNNTPSVSCDYGVNNIRISTGLVYRLGSR